MQTCGIKGFNHTKAQTKRKLSNLEVSALGLGGMSTF
jgi:hypothetical protein